MSSKKCYGTPLDIQSGKFLNIDSATAWAQSLVQAQSSKTYADIAKAVNVKPDLSSAQNACDGDSKCAGVVHWTGETLNPKLFPKIDDAFMPLKGYIPYSGPADIVAVSSYIKNANTPAGRLTFTPVVTCPPEATNASVVDSTPDTFSQMGSSISGGISSIGSSMGADIAATGQTIASALPTNQACPVAPGSPASIAAQPVDTKAVPSTTTGIIIASVIDGVLILVLAYMYFFRASETPFGSRAMYFTMYSALATLLIFGILFIVEGVMGERASSGNLAPTPVDSNNTSIISAIQTPPQAGTNGGNYGMQWWMYIKDWDYKFGQEKPVFKRGESGTMNPYVYLHPTDNSLCVKVNVFSNSSGHGSSSSPAPTGADGSSTDDSFTCVMKNVPLQTWFCVCLSMSGRNLDLYQDGRLVRSCLLPGVPKSPQGNLQIMPDGGFSGSVIDVYHLSRALTPLDAQSFCSKGTNGTKYDSLPTKTLFGYKVKFGVVDDGGKEIKQYTF